MRGKGSERAASERRGARRERFYPHKDLGEARFDKMLDELLVADEAAQVDREKELMTGVHSVARA